MTHDSGLPDPDFGAEFYKDIPVKRLIAWGIDVAIISLASLVFFLLGGWLFLFVFPMIYMTIGVLYRSYCLSKWSGTLGMRILAIRLVEETGMPLGPTTAWHHTFGHTMSIAIAPLQLISIWLIATSPRAQGLTDHILKTAALNDAAHQ